MSGDYTVAVAIDAWTATINKGDATDPAADAITMDPLRATWSMNGPYPAQPTPTVVTFGLYVPAIATGPRPVQGSRVEITITTPDHDPAKTEIRPVFEFVGLITSCPATPLEDGIAFSITATDYRSTLGEERIGDTPWPAESRKARLARIVAASAGGLLVPAAEQLEMDIAGLGPDVAARDVDSQPTMDLLTELLAAGVVWMGTGPSFWVTGYVDSTFRAPRLCTWARPIIGQSVDAFGNVTFPIVFVTGGGPDADAMLPYTVAVAGGTLQLVRKAITPDTSLVAWVPASAVNSEGLTWAQDKASNTNRVRAVGPDFVTQGLAHVGSLAAEFSDLVDTYGPNESVVSLDAAQSDYTTTTDLIYAMLGTHYDASPRWALDEVEIRADEIAPGDQWPRLFDTREHTDLYDTAAGRFVLITDCAAKWNLHDRGDYFGRLAGATLTLAGGRIIWTASLAHRLPWGSGVVSNKQVSPFDVDPDPTHAPITYAELAAGANPTYAQCGDLTPADLQLVEG